MYRFFRKKTKYNKYIFVSTFKEPIYNKSLTMTLYLNEPNYDFIISYSSLKYRLDMILVDNEFGDRIFDSTIGYFTSQNDVIKHFQYTSFSLSGSYGNRADIVCNIFKNETTRTNVIDGIKNILVKTFGV